MPWLYECHKQFKMEKHFTSWHLSLYNSDGALEFKLSDADRRIKPFDAFIVRKWSSYYIEYKITKSKTTHPYRLLRGSSLKKHWGQVIGLTKALQNGWKALVITYCIPLKRYYISNFADLDFNTKISFHER